MAKLEKQKSLSDLDFEIIEENDSKVVYRKKLLYEPSREYLEKLPTVTLHSFTDEQYNALQKAYDEVLKKHLSALEESKKQKGSIEKILMALKSFVFE